MQGSPVELAGVVPLPQEVYSRFFLPAFVQFRFLRNFFSLTENSSKSLTRSKKEDSRTNCYKKTERTEERREEREGKERSSRRQRGGFRQRDREGMGKNVERMTAVVEGGRLQAVEEGGNEVATKKRGRKGRKMVVLRLLVDGEAGDGSGDVIGA
jgi:hypothetical protein